MATNLYEFITSQGQKLPSVEERRKLYGLGKDYVGTAEQNKSLLTKLQTAGATPATPATPETLPSGEPNNLLTFKETLSKVTNLAREKRNALSLEFMMPFQGIAPASDFNSILSNLNRASDTFAQDILKQTQPKYELRNVGDDLMEFELDASGKVKGSRVVVSKPKEPATLDTMKSGEIRATARKKFGSAASTVINALNEEQLREFIGDFEATEEKLNVSLDVPQFLKEWEKQTGLEKEITEDRKLALEEAAKQIIKKVKGVFTGKEEEHKKAVMLIEAKKDKNKWSDEEAEIIKDKVKELLGL